MRDMIAELVRLGKIPNNGDISDELFRKYDRLIEKAEPLTYDEAEILIVLFSDDCLLSDQCFYLNEQLFMLIESVDFQDIDRYQKLISKCSSKYYKELFEARLNNYIQYLKDRS
ncbi:MAG: hypothetical protein IJ060_10625 [Oscillospiraceae bacterium]|nr:hypothetical protein [Oscillospiraceae bacterium]